MARRELNFQNHVLDSYELAGGYGKKWSSEWAAGNPDLVLALHGFGVHLMELKHRELWSVGKEYMNPLTQKQRTEARRWREAGGNALGGVVIGEKAINSTLCLFMPTQDPIVLQPELSLPYNFNGIGSKFPVETLLNNWSTRYGWQ
jgi:hypothetical protein